MSFHESGSRLRKSVQTVVCSKDGVLYFVKNASDV